MPEMDPQPEPDFNVPPIVEAVAVIVGVLVMVLAFAVVSWACWAAIEGIRKITE